MNKQSLAMLMVLMAALAVVDRASAWWIFDAAGQAPVKAQAVFDMDGVKGAFKFYQMSPSEPTSVEYDLRGLKGNNKLYHVHVRPVPAFDPAQASANATLLASLCSDPATGGHLNPHKITAKLPPKSAPLDQYELGDFSGKHGPLQLAAGDADHYSGSFTDDKISLKGEHGIIGRSIVVHKNNGARWVCANVVESTY